MLNFVIGFFVGGFVGLFSMCLCYAASRDEREEER